MTKKLIVISDWADDSLNRQELSISVQGYLNNPGFPVVSFVSSTPSTIHASFLATQVVEVEERLGRPLETVIFVDCDLHTESAESQLLIIRLKTGLYLIGPNAGYSFSGVKSKIDRAFNYPELIPDSKFRARDTSSRLIAHLLESMQDDLKLDEVHLDQIPQLQGFYIGHIDNFGNLKTTVTEELIKGIYSYGQRIPVRVNGKTHHLRYVEHLSKGQMGEFIIYPGSSGDKLNPNIEIAYYTDFSSKHMENAATIYEARPGMEMTIEGL